MQKIFCLLTIYTFVLLSGCSTPPAQPVRIAVSEESPHFDPEAALAQAEQESDPLKRNQLLLKVAEDYWNKNLIAQAKAAADNIAHSTLPPPLQSQFWQLQLRISSLQKDKQALQQATSQANNPALFQTSTEQQKQLVEQLVIAYSLLEQHLDAATTLIEHAGLYSSEESVVQVETIWQLLRATNTTDLTRHQYTGQNYDMKGWLELAKAIKLSQASLNNQYLALQNWNEQWPLHPAATSPPSELYILAKLPQTTPTKIVLALPFSGSLSQVAAAIRDGFLANYYSDNRPQESQLDLITYDTNASDFMNIYDKTLPENTVIIGPLNKNTLHKIASSPSQKYRTLALNSIETDTANQNLYFFSLNPEHETRQIGHKMKSDQQHKIAVIAPDNSWGHRLLESFQSTTQENHSLLIESALYDTQKTLAEAVSRLLATKQSRDRANVVRNITGLRFEKLPRRRQDIDAIFMAAKPEIAKQLKPLLAYHYAQDIPVYATSQVHDPLSAKPGQDLNGIKFVDMPWMLSSAITLKQDIIRELPKAASQYSRFFALGADTYQLASRLELLSKVENSFIDGQTGRLSISNNNVIERELQWAQFKNGQALILNH